MPAMVQHRLAADDDVVHAVGGLHPPGHTRGPIVRHLVLLHPDAREVEDHQVGRQSLAHETAVVETHDARRLEGQSADGVFEAEELPFPDPFPEHEDADRKSTRLNSSHQIISYAVFCLKKKTKTKRKTKTKTKIRK